MRAPRLVHLVLGIGLACLGASATAAGSRVGLLPWGELALLPAAPESPALGPDLLAAGPDGQIALWDPASGLVHLYPSVDAALAGDPGSAFALAVADDLAWTGAGLLVLDGRRLLLFSEGGQPAGSRTLPDLAPTGLTLWVEGSEVYGADVFGNRHPLASLADAQLRAPTGRRMLPPEVAVRWDPKRRVLSAGERRLSLPEALRASGRVISGGGERWLVVEAVVGESPLRVERQALSLRTGAQVLLPTSGRLYAPSDDLAVDGRGALIWMAPLRDGLRLGEVSP